MNRLKRITVDRSVKVKCFELKDCKDLETVSGISFKKIRVLNICGCPELKNLPVICAPSCLEVIIINGCWKLDYLALTGCGILKRVSGNFDLVGLSISDCPMLQELPSLGCLIHLEEIRILQCGNLQNITLPTTITKLTLQKCRNLQVEGMSNLTKLAELNISECPEIEEFPVFCGLSCLEKIIIDGYRKLNYLHMIDCAMLKVVGYNFDMGHLAQLLISDCPELEELPCLTRLNCLEEVRIVRCKKLQKLSLPETLKYLQLDSCKELKSVSEISRLKNLVELIISGCEQLELELCLEVVNSLQSITFDGSGKLKSFLLNKCENLKRVSGNFDVERISICGCPELEELSIPDCSGLSCLKEINIESCDKLQNITLPSKLTSLTNFIVQNCRHLQRITGIDDLSKLTELCIRECPEIELPILPKLSCLERISVNYCEKLHKIILPASVLKITVQWCRKLQTVAAMGDLSKLTELHITKCPDLEELPVLYGLRSLESITIDGCGKLNRLKVFDCGPICKELACSFDLGHLAQLWISDCPELDELSCLARLTCLQGISIVRCMKLQRITLPLTLKNFHLDSCKELKSVSEISRLMNLVELIISKCVQLELELRLEDMDSLQTIACDGCAKIKSFQLNKHQYLKKLSGHFDVEWISICGCDELEELSIRDCPGQNCLEKINIESCANLRNITLPTKLTNLVVQGCKHLQRIVGMDDLTALTYLYINECPLLEELPNPTGLSFLERITIESCDNLHSLTLPTTLTNVRLQRCRNLQKVAATGDLTKLEDLSISECPQLEELPNPAGLSFLERITIESCDNLHSLTLPTTLIKVKLQRCRNLPVAGVSGLTKLTELHISECPLFEEMSVVRGLSWLERITIDGCVKISYLHVIDCAILKTVRGNLDMVHLAQLMVSDCPKLEELPSFTRLTFLVEIRIFRCRKLQKVTLPRTLKNLQLDSCPELKTMSEISHLKNLVELIISRCGQLELELHLKDMDSLRTIASDGCGKIKSFRLNRCQNLKRLSAGNLDVERVSICGCPELQELSINDCPGLHCLKKLNIKSCDKLQNITLPAELTNLIVKRCRHLQRITGMGNLSKLTELHISKCPDLEELSVLFGLNSLESITIDGCGKVNSLKLADCGMSEGVSCSFDLGHLVQLWISDCPVLEELACFAHLTCLERISIIRSTKLQRIALPITLKYLHLDSCKELRQVSKMGHLSKLTELYISECPLIEELPILGGQSCLERITIYSCEKLHKITLPTTLRKLTVQWCRKLQTVAAMGYLSKLTDMCIGHCPELEELLNLAGLNNVTLPTTLIKLRVQRYRELPILGRLSCLKSIVIESCERLENIQGFEELEALEAIQFLYCSNAAVQDCISKLKHMPSNFIQVVGRAADGAKSNLKRSLLSQAYFPHSDIASRSDIIIICRVVVVSRSASPHTINDSLEDSPWKLDLPQGEWVITTIMNGQNYRPLYLQYEIPSMRGIMKRWREWSVRGGNDWRICYALTTIADKLHQK